MGSMAGDGRRFEACCQCLCQLVACMGNNILHFKDSNKLVTLLANYLNDAS